jgi:ComF family protein
MTLFDRVLEVLYVPHCPACDDRVPTGHPLCLPCAASLVELGPACPRCAEPFAAPPAVECARCRRGDWPLDAGVAPWRFGGELARALRRLKFGPQPHIARDLAPLIAPFLDAAVTAAEIDVIVPVPLHWRRLAQRGFNQAQALAEFARRTAGISTAVDTLILQRVRATPPQTGLRAAARAASIAGAFAVPRRRGHRVAGRRVLLLDDVVTTGATMAAAARALRSAGAGAVVGFSVARAE